MVDSNTRPVVPTSAYAAVFAEGSLVSLQGETVSAKHVLDVIQAVNALADVNEGRFLSELWWTPVGAKVSANTQEAIGSDVRVLDPEGRMTAATHTVLHDVMPTEPTSWHVGVDTGHYMAQFTTRARDQGVRIESKSGGSLDLRPALRIVG